MLSVWTRSHPFCGLVSIMKSHEYNNVATTAQIVLVPRLFSISMADNLAVLSLSCGYDLTNLPLERRSLNGTSSSSVVRLWRMFAQDELSLGGFLVDIVEDLFDPVSCKGDHTLGNMLRV